MRKKRKRLSLLALSSVLLLSLVGCGNSETSNTSQEKTEKKTDLTLEQVNEFLNTSADLGPGTVVNPVAIIPMKHIDGPKNNTDVYAFVNFQYEARDFIKYQVSYISCTCRPAEFNFWNTAYMEFTLPSSKNPDEAVLKTLSFDKDSSDKYNGGLWADSDPIPSGVTYETIKTEYLPYFEGKDIATLKSLDQIEDIDLTDYQTGEGREAYALDTYTGATVSTNNIIRIINAVADYHSQNAFFEQ